MPNSFYNHSTYPTPNSPGSSALLRAELDLITAGFDKLPTLSGNGNKLVAVNSAGTALEPVSGNVSLPANLSVTGSTTLGDAAGDGLTIWPSAVTWSSNPTHSGNHTWSGTHTLSAGTANQVQYLNGSKLLTGSAGLTFDGTYLAATFQDTGFTLKDNSDATKVATFELSGITTGQTRAYTLPDISGALATLGNLSQTFAGSVNFTNASFTVGATSIAIGNSGVATSLNLGFGSTGSGVTKTVNLGTGGASGSTTNITVGSGVAGSTTSIFFNSGGVTAGQFTGGVFSLSTALAVSSGGTGAATLTGVVKGNGTSAFTAGNVNLASEVTGTLPVANGGTGLTSFTANGIVYASSSSALTTGSSLVFSSGKLGIGTSSPAQTLDVSGVVNSVQARFGNVAGRGLEISTSVSANFPYNNDAEVALNARGAGVGKLIFQTDSTYRGCFNSNGDFVFKASGTPTQLDPGFLLQNTANGPFIRSATSVSTTYTHYEFYNANGIVGTITTSGSATAYNTTSDYRLKTFIFKVTGSGARIDALNPIEYEWNVDGKRARGFFAHEFQSVYPDSVTGEKDATDEEGNPVYQAMQAATSEVIADLVAEIQSLRARVAALEAA